MAEANSKGPHKGLTPALAKKLARIDAVALERFADFGPMGFNSLLGHDEWGTFDNLEKVFQFLAEATHPERGVVNEETMYGFLEVMNLLWGVAQWERDRLEAKNGGAA